MRMENRLVTWYLRLLQYIQEAINDTERHVKDNLGYQWKIPKISMNPFLYGYETALDVLTELDPVLLSY